MTALGLFCALAAGGASLTIGLRSMMLRKEIRTKPTAPWVVTFAIQLVAAAAGAASFSLWRGAEPNWREALVYTALAIGGLIMLVHMVRQKHQPENVADRGAG